MGTLVSAGRLFYAIGIIAFGLEHLVHADFVTRVVPYWPAWMPGHALWAYAVGLALVLQIYRRFKSLDVEALSEMKG